MFVSFAIAMQTYKEVFTLYGHKQFADSLPEPQPGGLANEGPTPNKKVITAVGNSSVNFP